MYTPSSLITPGEKKRVRNVLKLLPYTNIRHFKHNDELGVFFFSFFFFLFQTDSQNSVLAIEEYSLVRIYRFIPMD